MVTGVDRSMSTTSSLGHAEEQVVPINLRLGQRTTLEFYNFVRGKVLGIVLAWSWVTDKFREIWCDDFAKTMLVGGSDNTDQWGLII